MSREVKGRSDCNVRNGPMIPVKKAISRPYSEVIGVASCSV